MLLADQRDGRLAFALIPDRHDHLGTRSGERSRDAEPDTVARAGDHRALPREVSDRDVVLPAWHVLTPTSTCAMADDPRLPGRACPIQDLTIRGCAIRSRGK